MSYFLKFSYYLGQKKAMTEMGLPEPEFQEEDALLKPQQQQPVEELTGDSLGAAGLGMASADDFVSFVNQDQTEDAVNDNLPLQSTDEKQVNWGGRSSLEGGDAGTRNEQMGLPRFSGA